MSSSPKHNRLFGQVLALSCLVDRKGMWGLRCFSHMFANQQSWLGVLIPTALATALDVGLSNWSFLYITVSL